MSAPGRLWPCTRREPSRGATRSGGDGETRRRCPSSTRRRWAPCASGSASWTPSPRAAELDELRAAAGRAAARRRCSRRSAPRTSSPRRGPRAPRRPAAATPTSPGCALGSARRGARRGRPARRRGRAAAPGARGLRRRGRRRRPLRRRHQRRRRGRAAARRPRPPDQPRPARLRDVEVDRRSLTATLGAGLRGPEAEAALGARRPRPRPLPAVLRVRDDRRLRRDPLGRAGLERLRALRRAGQLGAADRARPASCARWRRRTPPPGPALRELIVGSEGTLGVIPDVTVRVRPAPERAPLRGLDRRGLRGGGRDRPRARPGAGPARRDPASPTRRRPGSRWPCWGRAALGRRALRRATWALRRRAGGCLMIVGHEGERGVGRPAPGARRARAARRRRRLPRPGGRALLGARPLPGPLPARHADGDGGDGRDARDLAHLVAPAATCTARSATRSATRSPARARRGSSSATSPTPTPTAPRSTSPSSPAPARAPRSSSGGRSSGPPREAIVAAGGTITHHHAVGRDHAPYMEAEVGRTGPRGAARAEGAARPGRDHEPRQAAPLTRRALPSPASTIGPVTGPRGRRCRRSWALSSSLCACGQRGAQFVVGDQRDFHFVEAAGEQAEHLRRRSGSWPEIDPGLGRLRSRPAAAARSASGPARPCRTGPAARARRPFGAEQRATTFFPSARTAPGRSASLPSTALRTASVGALRFAVGRLPPATVLSLGAACRSPSRRRRRRARRSTSRRTRTRTTAPPAARARRTPLSSGSFRPPGASRLAARLADFGAGRGGLRGFGRRGSGARAVAPGAGAPRSAARRAPTRPPAGERALDLGPHLLDAQDPVSAAMSS